jgi:hypothetical protein
VNLAKNLKTRLPGACFMLPASLTVDCDCRHSANW